MPSIDDIVCVLEEECKAGCEGKKEVRSTDEINVGRKKKKER